ncbi:hypothetical protein BC828DRAFT_378882 [Blastocladiella britannica]|nr:hypothetical protein BC828DRAFT_378882 [Blastocladiella britannica]
MTAATQISAPQATARTASAAIASSMHAARTNLVPTGLFARWHRRAAAALDSAIPRAVLAPAPAAGALHGMSRPAARRILSAVVSGVSMYSLAPSAADQDVNSDGTDPAAPSPPSMMMLVRCLHAIRLTDLPFPDRAAVADSVAEIMQSPGWAKAANPEWIARAKAWGIEALEASEVAAALESWQMTETPDEEELGRQDQVGAATPTIPIT